MRRRTFVATAAGFGTTALAGCSGGGDGGGGDGGDGSGGSDGSGGETDDSESGALGTFQLLISDQPAAIGDFDSLDVTLSSARVFRADEDEEVTSAAVTGTESTPDDDESGGFVEFDLDDVTVDLTQVVGDRAVSVLESELEAGRYSGIELRVASAEGVVDGEDVDVMVPSNRLRIVRPFEVAPDAELDFVFDINVVKKGQSGEYNLLPVIGKSGVAGEDVDVEEVEEDDSDDSDTPDATETATPETPDGNETAT
ncbi:DUF4382 domain-containing protein [Haloplanus sp. C73]|uniref:DUF4382 domain-containing protein n=1 Tax=Haloplanus sp. C73 TaxID=3421641 RepID=UPI003EB90D30